MTEIICALAGANFRPASAKAAVRELDIGDELSLERDPENPYDSNAVKVIDPASGEFIGFVPKAENPPLAQYMDEGGTTTVEVISFLSELVPHLRITLVDDEEPSSS